MSAIGDQRVPGTATVARPGTSAAVLAGWVPVALWMAVIFSLSSDRFSDVHTAAWLSGVFESLGIPPAVAHVGNFIVRKSAHFVEYAVLGVLIFRAARVTWPLRATWQPFVVAVAGAAACAGLDELRQYVVTATRTGSVRDVAVDAAGALAGASYLYRRARRRTA